MGGDRQFITDPNSTGIATAVGDGLAGQLQILHLIRGLVDDGQRAAVDRLADSIRVSLEASNVSKAREQSTREMQPLTRLPAVQWGDQTNITQIRLNNIAIYSGLEDPVEQSVQDWMDRVFNLAESYKLTFAAAFNLLIQAAKGGAAGYLQQMKKERKTLPIAVQLMEMRYGGLCTPEEARVKCNSMLRRESEGLPEFLDRFRVMAKMACRMEEDDELMNLQIDALVENNIRRVLSPSVLAAFEARMKTRQLVGASPLKAREMEKECLDIEREKLERRQSNAENGLNKRHVRMMHLEQQEALESEDELISSEDEAEPADEATYDFVREIRQQEQRFVRAGRPIDKDAAMRRAVRNFNGRQPQKVFGQRKGQGAFKPKYAPAQGARQAAGVPAGQGYPPRAQVAPPNPLANQNQGIRKTIEELLALANCPRGNCIKCGQPGHMMNNDACALRDKPLMDRPCMMCGVGLHQANNCMVAFQKQYVAQVPQLMAQQQQPQQPVAQQPQQARLVQSETLNET